MLVTAGRSIEGYFTETTGYATEGRGGGAQVQQDTLQKVEGEGLQTHQDILQKIEGGGGYRHFRIHYRS